MPIPDKTFFGSKLDGTGAILFGEVCQITDEHDKLLLLKRRLEAYLTSQIDPIADSTKIYSPFPLTVLTCIAVETLGRVISPISEWEKDKHKDKEISKLVSVRIYGELDKKLTRPLNQEFKASMQALWPNDKVKDIKSYAELFHSYLRTSFMHGYRSKNVFLKAELEEGWAIKDGFLIINPYWFWKEYKRVFEESFEKIFDKKEKNNPYRINALAYFHRLINE